MLHDSTKEEPNLPMIPSLGDEKKKNLESFQVTVVACYQCDWTEERDFKVGDFVFKNLDERSCPGCDSQKLYIREIFEDFRDKKKRGK
ncbi:MAG: hypothetical protein ACTSU5_04495 [Promethearchaeota archaeon]